VSSQSLPSESVPATRRPWWRRLAASRTVVAGFAAAGALSLLPVLNPAATHEPAAVEAASAAVQATTVQARSSARGNLNAYAFLSQQAPGSPIARWNPCQAITYRVNDGRASAGALADVQEALHRVTSVTGLQFAYQGTTTVIPGAKGAQYPSDTELIVAWARPGDSSFMPARAAGQGGPAGEGGASWVAAKDAHGHAWGKIVQGYVVLDATLPLAGGFGAGPATGWQGTRGQLLMHEIGHSVGLDHPKIADQAQIMYPTLSRKYAGWGAGDLTGLRILGTASGCL
jgi:hypothetical protein